MARAREVRSYDYVNHPYERVRDALRGDALKTFRAATRAATDRAHDLAAALRVNIGGLQIARDIVIEVKKAVEERSQSLGVMVTRIELEWEAAESPRLFPLMRAELSVYPLSSTETQLDFLGHYDPPLGALGKAINAIVGHRLAEASVHRFLTDVATFLRATLK